MDIEVRIFLFVAIVVLPVLAFLFFRALRYTN